MTKVRGITANTPHFRPVGGGTGLPGFENVCIYASSDPTTRNGLHRIVCSLTQAPWGQSRFWEKDGKTQNCVHSQDQGSIVPKVRCQSKVNIGNRVGAQCMRGQAWV